MLLDVASWVTDRLTVAFAGPSYFHPVLGRPSTPVECYLRPMFLKFRYRLGFESLCAEVSDPISWRRFCRIGRSWWLILRIMRRG